MLTLLQSRVSLCSILVVTLIIATLAFGSPAPQNNSSAITSRSHVLEDGTPVKLRISRTVSSADAHVGDTVDFEVLEEIRVGNLLLIPKGGVAWGTVTEAEAKRRMARGGKLNMNIDSVRLVDGEKVALRAIKEMKGGGHTGAMTGGIVATAIVFWPAAPFFLFMHGKDITVPKGTEITSYINGNFPFDAAKFEGGEQSPQAVRSVSAATSVPNNSGTTTATLEILSSPGSADIELDGNFAGNTPSSMGVAEGEHKIRITKSGYKSWERQVRTSTGAIKITADLEAVAVATPVKPAAPIVPVAVTEDVKAPKTPVVSAAQPAAEPKPKISESPAVVPLETKSQSPVVRPAVLKIVEHPVAPAPVSAASAPLQSAADAATEGTASITSTPDGADIFVDSVGYGKTPVLLKLKPGKHSVQLVLSGYQDWVSDVEVKAGSIVNVTAAFAK